MSSDVTSTRFGGPRGGNILGFPPRFRAEPTASEVFLQTVSQWFFAANMLRFFEASALAVPNPTGEDLGTHRVWCSNLIAFGEFASHHARQNPKVALSAIGIRVEDIQAETSLLRANFRMFHNEMISKVESEKILAEAFNEA